jgi:hypothetical protein
MIYIGLLGNCQTVGLCILLQELLNNNSNYSVYWCCYGDEFIGHLGPWSNPCNKILNYEESVNYLKKCDFIIYQNVCEEKSPFLNKKCIQSYKKPDTKLISIPSIYVNYNFFDASIIELQKREKEHITIPVSDIFLKYRDKQLLLTVNHPTTFLFLEILRIICSIIGIQFYDDNTYNYYIQNINYLNLP